MNVGNIKTTSEFKILEILIKVVKQADKVRGLQNKYYKSQGKVPENKRREILISCRIQEEKLDKLIELIKLSNIQYFKE